MRATAPDQFSHIYAALPHLVNGATLLIEFIQHPQVALGGNRDKSSWLETMDHFIEWAPYLLRKRSPLAHDELEEVNHFCREIVEGLRGLADVYVENKRFDELSPVLDALIHAMANMHGVLHPGTQHYAQMACSLHMSADRYAVGVYYAGLTNSAPTTLLN